MGCAAAESMGRVPMGSTTQGKDTFGPQVAARYPEGLTGGRYGIQTMCEAQGMANATIIERI